MWLLFVLISVFPSSMRKHLIFSKYTFKWLCQRWYPMKLHQTEPTLVWKEIFSKPESCCSLTRLNCSFPFFLLGEQRASGWYPSAGQGWGGGEQGVLAPQRSCGTEWFPSTSDSSPTCAPLSVSDFYGSFITSNYINKKCCAWLELGWLQLSRGKWRPDEGS